MFLALVPVAGHTSAYLAGPSLDGPPEPWPLPQATTMEQTAADFPGREESSLYSTGDQQSSTTDAAGACLRPRGQGQRGGCRGQVRAAPSCLPGARREMPGRGSVCADSMAVFQPPAFLRAPGPPEEELLQGRARERPVGLTKGRL